MVEHSVYHMNVLPTWHVGLRNKWMDEWTNKQINKQTNKQLSCTWKEEWMLGCTNWWTEERIIKTLNYCQHLCCFVVNRSHTIHQLRLALAWNRIDIARTDIFTEGRSWRVCFYYSYYEARDNDGIYTSMRLWFRYAKKKWRCYNTTMYDEAVLAWDLHLYLVRLLRLDIFTE